jgi:hypothetical protein
LPPGVGEGDAEDAEDTEDTIEDGAGRTTEVSIELTEEAVIPMVGWPIRLMAAELEVALDEPMVIVNETDPAPGAAMPDCEDDTEVLLRVGVASAEILTESPVGRLISTVTVTRIVTVSIAVSVMTRYLRARSSR